MAFRRSGVRASLAPPCETLFKIFTPWLSSRGFFLTATTRFIFPTNESAAGGDPLPDSARFLCLRAHRTQHLQMLGHGMLRPIHPRREIVDRLFGIKHFVPGRQWFYGDGIHCSGGIFSVLRQGLPWTFSKMRRTWKPAWVSCQNQEPTRFGTDPFPSLGKAVEGHRSPSRFAFTSAIDNRASVLGFGNGGA